MILASPTLLGRTSTLTLGTIIEQRVAPILPMPSTQLPRLFHLDFDYVVVATGSHIVVVVEGNHAIVQFRVDKKSCLC